MKYIGLVVLLVLSLGVGSLSPVGPCDRLNQPSALDGSDWILTGMGDAHDNLRGVSRTPPVTLAFRSTGSYSGASKMQGSTGCRDYRIGYVLGDSAAGGFSMYTVGSLGIPPGGCTTLDLFEREVEYRVALQHAKSATLTHDGRGLVIEAAGGWVLTFQINPRG